MSYTGWLILGLFGIALLGLCAMVWAQLTKAEKDEDEWWVDRLS